MLVIVALFSLIIVALSTYGLITPRGYISFARRFQAGPGVWGGSVIRLVLSIALWVAAPSSATPYVFRVLALVTALGAVALPAMGAERFARLIEWGSGKPFWVLQSLCFIGLIFGLFLLWSSATGLAAAIGGAPAA
jgi:hypothetical protein